MALKSCIFFSLLIVHISSSLNNRLPRDEKSLLLLVRDKKILLINAKNLTERRVIIEHTRPAVAVDFFYDEGLIFFTEASNKENGGKPGILVTRFDKPGTPSKIISKDLRDPDGIAVDWIGRNIYWTDSQEKRIEVSDLNGKNRKVLFWENLDRPRAIVVDPLRGYLFWTDWGEKAKIERASMDGSDRRIIVDKNLQWPNGLTIDFEQSRLYWVDGYTSEIASCDLAGRDIKFHYKMKSASSRPQYGQHPFAMTVLHQNLYVSDWGLVGVFSIEKQNATIPKKIIDFESRNDNRQPMRVSRVMDIKGFGLSRQPHLTSRNPCSVKNGNCSHLCLLKARKPYFACRCPTGIIHDKKTNSCPHTPESLLILAKKSSLYKISLDTKDFALQTLPVESPTPVVVDYDPIDKMVYWADLKTNQVIQRANLDGSGQEEVVGADIRHPDGLAVDWIARNMYWTDTEDNRILMSRLDGSSLRVLVWKNLDEPRAIAVDPIHGYLFWSDWGHTGKIERSYLDGTNRTVIESHEENVVWPNGLAIDNVKKHVYYSDARLDLIQRCNYDGSNRTVIVNVERFAPHIFGFSFLNDYLYYTDWQRRSVGRVSADGRNRQILLETNDLMGLKAVSLQSQGLNAPNNPCHINQGNCSHICLFYPYRFPHRKCACPYDYILNANGRTCKKVKSFLIYSMKDELHRISTELPRSYDPLDVLPLAGVFKAGPIAFEYRTKRLFWVDQEKNGIFQSLLNGSHASAVIEKNVEKPRCLAVDWIHRNLYYGYLKPRPRIEMVSIQNVIESSNKFNKFVVVHQSLKEPTALAVDPNDGRLYWADSIGGQKYKKVKVERAYLDGSGRETVFVRSASITDLIVDSSSRRLLWIERDKIMSCDLKGYNKTKIFGRIDWEIKGLDIDEHYIYFTEARAKTIYRLRIGSYIPEVLENLSQAATGLILFSPYRQRGKCRCCRKGCYHFCLPKRHTFDTGIDKCACATHYRMLNDKLTCQEPNSYLFAVTAGGQVIRIVPGSTPLDVALFIPGIRRARSIVVVPEERYLRIFYIDYEKRKIRNVRTKSEELTELDSNHLSVESNKPNFMRRNSIDSSRRSSRQRRPRLNASSPYIVSPYELAYDPINRYLFWTDTRNHVINVTSVKGEAKGAVVDLGSRVPKSIAIDPLDGHIYWVSTNANGSDPRIERSELDGNKQRVIVSDNLGSPGNLLVYKNHLYWIDPKTISLERWDIISNVRMTLFHGQESALINPAGLVALKGILYWYSNEVLWMMEAVENAYAKHYRLEGYGKVIDMVSVGNSDDYSNDGVSVSLKSRIKQAQKNCGLMCMSMCIPSANKEFRCGCPIGYYLNERQKCVRRQSCPPGHLHCGNSKDCFNIKFRCDGTSDCANHFDEQNCPFCEGKGQFLCGNGECLPKQKRCDGHHDCDTDELCCPKTHCADGKCVKVASPDPKCASDPRNKGLGNWIPKEHVLDDDVSSRTTYTVAVVVAVLAVVLTCGIAGYTCTRRGRHTQDPSAPYVMHTDQLDIMLVPNGPLFSQTPSVGDSDNRPSSHSRLGPCGSTGCPSSALTPTTAPPPSVPSLPTASSKRRGARTPQPDVISFYERDRLTGASRSDTEAPDYACPLNPPPSPITEVGTRGRARTKSRSRKRRHRSGGGGTGGRHHRRYHNVRLVIYTDAPPPTPRTCLSSAEEAGPGSNSPLSSRRSYNYNRPFPPPPSPENSSD